MSRSAQKRRAILDAARELFLQHGYLGTSMDDVARVSKQTVYKHFGDKRTMFIELLTGDMSGADAKVAALAEAVPDSQNLEADLRAFAGRTLPPSCDHISCACAASSSERPSASPNSRRLNEAMARPIDDAPVPEAYLHRYADEGVRVFMAAYGCHSSPAN